MVSFSSDVAVIGASPPPHARKQSDSSVSTTESDVHPADKPKRRTPYAATPYPGKSGFTPTSLSFTKDDSSSGPFGWLKKAADRVLKPHERRMPARHQSTFEDEAIAQLDGHEWVKGHLVDPAHDPHPAAVKLAIPAQAEKKYGHNRTGSRARSLTAQDFANLSKPGC